MKPKIIIIGAGGHGKVVCDAILAQGTFEVVGFVDASLPVNTSVFQSYKVIAEQSKINSLNTIAEFFVVAIGNNKIREELSVIAAKVMKPAIVIHPSATIAITASVGEGAVILANAVVNADAMISENTIVNSGVIVDHDCKIGKYVHLSIGTMVGSNSAVADYVTTSIGQKINSFSKIEE